MFRSPNDEMVTSMADSEAQSWERLQQILGAERDLEDSGREELTGFLDTLSSAQTARAVARLDRGDRVRLMEALQAQEAASLIGEIPEAQASRILEDMPPESAADVFEVLRSDQRADLLGSMPDKSAGAILEEMGPSEAADLRDLAAYPADVAGGVMITEFVAFDERATVDDVVADLRARAEDIHDYQIQYVYVTSESQLTGVVPLRDLIVARSSMRVSDVMLRDPVHVAAKAPLDELVDLFEAHSFLAVPVVDDQAHLLGIALRSAVSDALQERESRDHLKSQGILRGEELRTMPLRTRVGRRLSWLSVNIVLNMIAASVIAFYQETLASVIALAVFLPIISDMSGCSGNQSVAVSMRELALGLARPQDVFRVWWQEIRVGLCNGVVLGMLMGLACWLWKGNPYLGLVVGGALAMNTLVAVSLGGILPLVMRALKLDPALASGPVLTTVTDLVGFFLVLSFATAMLSRLV